MTELILKDEVYAIVGAAMEVYYKLGAGFLEPIYQECLALEMNGREIPYEREKRLEMFYKGVRLKKVYCPDFFCFDQIVVELKSQVHLGPVDQAQLINYLRISEMKVGALINFERDLILSGKDTWCRPNHE